MRDAAFGCDWVGTAIPFQRCLMFIIATANKEFKLTAGKFVPVSNATMMNVCNIYVCMYKKYIYTHLGVLEDMYIRVFLYIYLTLFTSNFINGV